MQKNTQPVGWVFFASNQWTLAFATKINNRHPLEIC